MHSLKQILSHRNMYLFGLVWLGASLPLSIYTTSLAEILLLANWIIEGKFHGKWEVFRNRESLWLISSIFLVHLLGLWGTSDLQYALHDLRIKLPLLILPLIIGTTELLTRKELKIVLLFFIAGTTVSSLISTIILLGWVDYPYNNIEQISLFVHHIRFSLMVDISIFILFYFLFSDAYQSGRKEQLVYLILAIWLIIFLFLLKALTGIVIFFVTSFVLGLLGITRLKKSLLRQSFIILCITLPLIVIGYLAKQIMDFYPGKELDPTQLESHSPSGNPYKHYPEKKQLENSNYVWIYICEPELQKHWNQRSGIPYEAYDKMGHEIKYTLIRYLTSLDLRKDSSGVHALTEKDIAAIESGVANHRFTDKIGIGPRIYQVIWELDLFFKGGNPSGHSVSQRLVYFRTAIQIIKENFWSGVGTGDVQQAFYKAYEKMDSPLGKNFRRRAHNQYLTFFVTFGVFGFLWILFALITPIFLEKKWGNWLFLMFFLIGFLSMLNEDTLETHSGISFFSYFYALFLLGINGHASKKQ